MIRRHFLVPFDVIGRTFVRLPAVSPTAFRTSSGPNDRSPVYQTRAVRQAHSRKLGRRRRDVRAALGVSRLAVDVGTIPRRSPRPRRLVEQDRDSGRRQIELADTGWTSADSFDRSPSTGGRSPLSGVRRGRRARDGHHRFRDFDEDAFRCFHWRRHAGYDQKRRDVGTEPTNQDPSNRSSAAESGDPVVVTAFGSRS